MKEIVLKTENLSKSFGSTKAVDLLNIEVQAGDIYGFLGPNGSGKTTSIRMFLNLINPDQGKIYLNGYDVHHEFIQAISRVGAIVETPMFYSYLSGHKNLEQMARLIPNLQRSKIDEVLELVGLTQRAQDKVKTYSLGMKQRLGIARALLNDPKLVILDEPTNGLDPQGMIEVREMIAQLAATHKITFFISTHLLHEVEQICNKVAILQRGRLLAQGKVKELLVTDHEVLEVYTPNSEQVHQILSDVQFIRSIEQTEQGVLIKLEKGHSAQLNTLLVSQGITVEYLIPRNQSLEKFFLDLTKDGDHNA